MTVCLTLNCGPHTHQIVYSASFQLYAIQLLSLSASVLVVMAWMWCGLAWLQHLRLPSHIDELIAALLPVSLCPGRGRPGYGRESQLWHPPWCRYYDWPAGGHWGWQPREQPWPTYCCHTPGDTHCEGRQGGVWDWPKNKGLRYWASR